MNRARCDTHKVQPVTPADCSPVNRSRRDTCRAREVAPDGRDCRCEDDECWWPWLADSGIERDRPNCDA